LFFGDGVLTPAISMLSAIEGLEVGTPGFKRWVLPLRSGAGGAVRAAAQGTDRVGKAVRAGDRAVVPAIGALGLWHRGDTAVLARAQSVHALRFFTTTAVESFVVLGAVCSR
jgi:KUP system potassium uptake protein